jgi:hypothetical protein
LQVYKLGLLSILNMMPWFIKRMVWLLVFAPHKGFGSVDALHPKMP